MCQLTNDFDGLLVVEFFVPVEHPQEGEGGEEDEADPEEHVAGETGKVDALEDTESSQTLVDTPRALLFIIWDGVRGVEQVL